MRLVRDPACRTTFFLGHVLMQWTVVAIAIGVGLDGEGGTPSPVSREDPHTSSTPPHPASGLLPRPRGGGSHGDTPGKAVPRIAAIWNKQVGFQQSQ